MPHPVEYTSRMVELLSLKRENGGCRLELGVILDGAHTRCLLDIGEPLYKELAALAPVNGERIRLSPYTGWDPFRKVHYGTLNRILGEYMETHYFDCPESFGDQLNQAVQQAAALLDLPVMPLAPGAVAGPAPRSRKSTAGIKNGRRRPSRTTRLAIVAALTAVFAFRSEGKLFTENAEALSPALFPSGWQGMPLASGPESAAAAAAENEADAELKDGAAAETGGEAETKEETAKDEPAAAVHPESAELIEISGDKSFYKLQDGYVALSFDDGPSVYTKKIVDILTEGQAAASFLFVGKNVEHFPDEVAYASGKGMAVGNHSWDHSQLTALSDQDRRENLARTNRLLEDITGLPVTLFRPPYGATDAAVSGTAKELNMKLLLWNRDAQDWNAKSPEDILRYFRQVEPSGGVYVLHEDEHTVAALPAIIQLLRDQGLKFAIFQ